MKSKMTNQELKEIVSVPEDRFPPNALNKAKEVIKGEDESSEFLRGVATGLLVATKMSKNLSKDEQIAILSLIYESARQVLQKV